ncbi:lipoyl(octanoyl) transferase LipB [Hyphococcus sp.]|uniref:lipoyl(octanoyl) transferase LipB n=1 Tax=Hyphococcus sp. TaxID=2038636 RepID=UPI003CCC2E21
MTDPTRTEPALKVWRDAPAQWAVSTGRIDYETAVSFMETRAAAIRAGDADELVWLLEHRPLYTGGTGAKPDHLLLADRFPVYKSSRGGQYTYHGPGQRVAYVMLDLEKRGKDIRAFVHALEQWIIETLGEFNVRGERRDGRVGVWVDRTEPGGPRREDKIAAIGVRVRRWVSFHGIALNVEPDLSHFSGITPCGIAEPGLGVTSLVDLGLPITLDDADQALQRAFTRIFGAAETAPAPVLNAAALT